MASREKDGWKWRRLVVFSLTILGLVLPFVPEVNADIYWPVYTLITGAVGAYIGFATWEDRGFCPPTPSGQVGAPRIRPDNPDY